MTVSKIAEAVGAKVYTSAEKANTREVKGCYIGDLLSLVMSRAECDNIWITIQTNVNIVAVATLTDVSCIFIAEGFEPDENTVKRAEEQGVMIIGGEVSAYQAAAKLVELGI